MKQIILHNLDSARSYHIFPPKPERPMYLLIIGFIRQPDRNIEVQFDTQEELDALLLAHKAPPNDEG